MENILQRQALKIGRTRMVKNIYCIGDNICTDIFGANLYNRYLHQMKSRQAQKSSLLEQRESEYDYEEQRRRFEVNAGGRGHQHSEGKRNNSIDTQTTFKTSEDLIQSRSIDHLLCGDDGKCETQLSGAENCFSVLVETGVYSRSSKEMVSLDHSPRDFLPVEDSYQEPTYTVNNVLDAVNLIFQKQRFS